MTTEKQAAANKANSQKSTGAKTPEGKAAVSKNAIKHGLLSKRILIAGENAEDYSALLDGLLQSLVPEGMLEQMLVEKVAMAFWKQKRLVEVEAATITLAMMSVSITTPDEVAMNASLGIPAPTKDEMALRQARCYAPVDYELLAKYTAGLDCELYRAIEALRKQKEFRLRGGIIVDAEVA